MLTPINISELSIDKGGNSQPSSEIINVYNKLYMKMQSTIKKMDSRMKTVTDLISLLTECTKNGIHAKEVFKIREFITELSETLTMVSKNEIELNHLYRELDKKILK